MISPALTRGLRPLVAAHLIGNALALWLGYYWLGVGESRTSTLLWSFVVALFTASFFCWLHGAGFAWRSAATGSGSRIAAPFRTSLRSLSPLLATAIAILALYALLVEWAAYSGKPAFTIASFLTQKLRKPVKPAAILGLFNIALWLVRWVVIPVLIVPVVSAIATRGWRGFSALKTLRRSWRNWLRTPLLLLAALWLPFQLLAWTPLMTGFGIELTSFAVRAAIAYLLFVAGLFTLEIKTYA